MLNYFNANKKNSLKKLELILNRRKFKQKSRSTIVKKILNEVIKNGDKALIRYEKQFSQVKIKSNSIKFSSKEIVNIANKIDKKLKKSIDVAYERIRKFHSKQIFSSFQFKDKFKNEFGKVFS